MTLSGGDVAGRIDEISSAVWAASAAASILERGGVGPFPADDPAARLVASFGLVEETPEGYVAVPAFADMVAGRADAFANALRSMLGQAATAAFAGTGPRGWNAFSDEILTAQGRASAMTGAILGSMVVPYLEDRGWRFAEGGRFLDVGVGVAELACAFCQVRPDARVVGLDPLRRAIELATKVVGDRGLAHRVELRPIGVEQLTDEEAFDLAWLPLPFIPAPAVPDGLHRIRKALRPGGWLVVAGQADQPGQGGDVARWQIHLAGGCLIPEADRDELLLGAGFEDLMTVPVPPGAPALLAARRPVRS